MSNEKITTAEFRGKVLTQLDNIEGKIDKEHDENRETHKDIYDKVNDHTNQIGNIKTVGIVLVAVSGFIGGFFWYF